MIYKRTCWGCKNAERPTCPEDMNTTCIEFSQRPATADELRAELLERAEAQTALAYTFKSGYLGQWGNKVFGFIGPQGRFGQQRIVPCVHRDGDEGIE
jgi:hypothetical protein